MVYGTPLAPYTFTVSGFVNGDTQATAITGTPSLTTTPATPVNVGSYPITAAQGTLSAANYTFTFQVGTLQITHDATTTVATPSSSSAM